MLFLLLTAQALAGPPLWDASDLTCRGGGYRFTFGGQKIEEGAKFCFNDGRSLLLAEKCREGKCAALGDAICRADLPAGAGNDGALICEKAGGLHQDGAFYDGKEWWTMDRCLFEEDHSFVDTGLVSARYGACPKVPGSPKR